MIFLKLCQCLNLTLPLACWQMAQMTQITQMCSGDCKCARVCAGVRRLEPGRPLALPNLADPDLLVFHCRTVGRLPTQTHASFMPYFEDFSLKNFQYIF